MRSFLRFFTLIALVFVSVISVHAEERIRDFQTMIAVQKDGSIQITETIRYDFGTAFRHGIYRDIPEIVYRENSNRYLLRYQVLGVRDEQGSAYRFTTLHSADHLRIKIGDPNTTITGLHTYILTYEVRGALTYFNDHTELYWNATGDQWDVPIDVASTTIILPESVPGNQLKLACYTGVLGSSQSNCSFPGRSGEMKFTTTQPLLSKEGMSVVIGFPIGTVARLEAEKYVSFFDRWYGQLLLVGLMLLAMLWYIVYPIWIIVKWFRYGRDPKPFEGEVRAWFDPPKTGQGRVLTPIETGSLVDERVDSRDVSALFVDLARRGYMKIEERAKNDFYLLQTTTSSKSDRLQPFEQELLKKLFEAENEVQVKNAKLYSVIQSTQSAVYSRMVEDGFFAKNPNSIRTFYIVMAVLGFMTFNMQLALVCVLFGIHMTRKTQTGANAAAIARSLKNFLGTQERQLSFQASKQMMFERLLPFAVAFGVEKIWAERFKDIALKQPSWYSSTSRTAFNSALFISHLDSSLRAVSVAAQPPHSSSGSGFSGGFSGGGGGGGGGGSW